MLSKLQENYENAVKAYIHEFCVRFDVYVDYWLNDIVGGIAFFADISANFMDIKYLIDNNLTYSYLYDYYQFNTYFGEKVKYSFDQYAQKRKLEETKHTEAGFKFDLDDFEKQLIYERI